MIRNSPGKVKAWCAVPIRGFMGFDVLQRGLFSGLDSFAGANRSAGAAVDAGVGIDVIDVAFRDGANGTFGQTSAASYATVGNNVCHNSEFFRLDNYLLNFECWCKCKTFL